MVLVFFFPMCSPLINLVSRLSWLLLKLYSRDVRCVGMRIQISGEIGGCSVNNLPNPTFWDWLLPISPSVFFIVIFALISVAVLLSSTMPRTKSAQRMSPSYSFRSLRDILGVDDERADFPPFTPTSSCRDGEKELEASSSGKKVELDDFLINLQQNQERIAQIEAQPWKIKLSNLSFIATGNMGLLCSATEKAVRIGMQDGSYAGEAKSAHGIQNIAY